MFENLTEKLQRAFKNLRGRGKLTEEHLDAALAEIRDALLEGDVNVGVADELLTNIRKKAIGSEVMLQLSPDQQVVKVVRDELAALLGKHAKPLFAAKPPSVWMIVGLQGSGKTTTTGKLAKWLTQHGHRPILVSTDVYRPAAREQLTQVDRKSTRLNSSHGYISYAVFCLKKKKEALGASRNVLSHLCVTPQHIAPPV